MRKLRSPSPPRKAPKPRSLSPPRRARSPPETRRAVLVPPEEARTRPTRQVRVSFPDGVGDKASSATLDPVQQLKKQWRESVDVAKAMLELEEHAGEPEIKEEADVDGWSSFMLNHTTMKGLQAACRNNDITIKGGAKKPLITKILMWCFKECEQ